MKKEAANDVGSKNGGKINMKRVKKGLLGLFLAAAMMFTSVDTGAFAAQVDSTGSPDIMTEGIEEALEAGGTEEETVSFVEQEPETEGAFEETDEEELQMDSASYGYVCAEGATYMAAGERMIHAEGDVKAVLDEGDIAEYLLVDGDGRKIAIWKHLEHIYTHDGGTRIVLQYQLYGPQKAGVYYAKIKTRGGIEYTISEVTLTDRPLVAAVLYDVDNYAYDNYGDYIHLIVEGVNLGDGSVVQPTLFYEGKTAATPVEVVPWPMNETNAQNGLYVWKLKKDSSLDWEKPMGLTLETAASVENLAPAFSWSPDENLTNPFEHVYYEGYKKKTEFQFKKGLGIPAGTAIEISMKDSNDSEVVASGKGTIDANGLLALTLKDSDGKEYVPVEAGYSFYGTGESRSCYLDISVTGRAVMENRWTEIFRYDIQKSGGESSDSYCYAIGDTGYIWTTDTYITVKLAISSDRLKDSGTLMAAFEGESVEMKKSGDYYEAGFSLENSLPEGIYWMEITKGNSYVGGINIYAMDSDSLYQHIQRAGGEASAAGTWVEFLSMDLSKKYPGLYSDESEVRRIWDEEGYNVEVFAPDGTKLDATITPIVIAYGNFNVRYSLPDTAKDDYGVYIRVTKNGKVGKYLYGGYDQRDQQLPTFYSVYSEANHLGDLSTDSLGLFTGMGATYLLGGEYYEDYSKRTGHFNVIQVSGSGVSYPVSVTFTKKNEATPIKTLSITKNKFGQTVNGTFYFLTSSDIAGLDAKEPYEIIVSDGYYSMKYTGYVGVYTGKKTVPQTVKVTSVAIDQTAPEVLVNGTTKLTYSVTPDDATVSKDAWKTSNAKVATVDANGVVTGVAEGTAKITVTVDGKSASVDIKVVEKKIPLTGLSLNCTEMELGIDETQGVGIVKTPNDATDTITCVSSDPEIAAVSNDGMVTGIKPGTATITVTGGGFTADCAVTVKAELKALKLNAQDITLTTGQTFILEAEPMPSGADMELSWKVSLPDSETGNPEDYVELWIKDEKSAQITGKRPGSVNVEVTDNATGKGAVAGVRITTSDLDQAVSEEESAKIEDALTNAEAENPDKLLWVSGLLSQYEYDGAPVEPIVAVYFGTTRLRLGKDYSITFKNNKGVGSAELTVTGKGSYNGKLTANYQIVDNTKSGTTTLKKAVITGLKTSYAYTGKEIIPEIKVSLDGKDLEKGKDFSLVLSKNTDAGTACLYVAGIGDYKDMIKKTFKITPVDLGTANVDIHVAEDGRSYRAGGSVPEVTVTYTDADGAKWLLKKGSDYKVSYKNNKTLNQTATVTVTGQGNFTKKAETTFVVTASYLNDMTMSVADLKYKANQKKGTAYQSKVTILDKDGKALKVNKDYVLTYQDMTAGIQDLSKATADELKKVKENDLIRVKAASGSSGTYTGELTAIYYLREPKDISKAKADKIPDQTYNGTAKEPKVTLTGLTEGTDYEILYYINNVEKGTASVVVGGTGAYSGTKTLKFKIIASNFNTAYLGAWDGETFVK